MIKSCVWHLSHACCKGAQKLAPIATMVTIHIHHWLAPYWLHCCPWAAALSKPLVQKKSTSDGVQFAALEFWSQEIQADPKIEVRMAGDQTRWAKAVQCIPIILIKSPLSLVGRAFSSRVNLPVEYSEVKASVTMTDSDFQKQTSRNSHLNNVTYVPCHFLKWLQRK